MDISCTDPCAWQREGKCALQAAPAALTSAAVAAGGYASACPFFADTSTAH